MTLAQKEVIHQKAKMNKTMKPQTLTEKNRAIIEEFAEIFYTQKDVKKAFTDYVSENYIQHSPLIIDGRESAIEMLIPKFTKPTANFSIKKIMVDGDLAVIHLHGKILADNPGVAVADFYRLKDGKIVEHWDVVQPVPLESINPHPMF
jgi:predicted SnoaL-like aldol condensation-catalyzing enzyme